MWILLGWGIFLLVSLFIIIYCVDETVDWIKKEIGSWLREELGIPNKFNDDKDQNTKRPS